MVRLFQNNLTVSSNVKTFFIIYFIKNAEFQFQTNGTKSKTAGAGEASKAPPELELSRLCPLSPLQTNFPNNNNSPQYYVSPPPTPFQWRKSDRAGLIKTAIM